MNGRIYDPILAKMLSADPTIPDPSESASYNRYAYVNNNPMRYSDPTGFTPADVAPIETIEIESSGYSKFNDDATNAFLRGGGGSTDIVEQTIAIMVNESDSSNVASGMQTKKKSRASRRRGGNKAWGIVYQAPQLTKSGSKFKNGKLKKTAQRKMIAKLMQSTKKIGFKLVLSPEVIELLGGDSACFSVGWELGLVFGESTGVYKSNIAGKELSLPFGAPSLVNTTKLGGLIVIGDMQGSFADFAGDSTAISGGIGIEMSGSVTDGGNYGSEVGFGPYLGVGAERHSTVVFDIFNLKSYSDGCDAFVC